MLHWILPLVLVASWTGRDESLHWAERVQRNAQRAEHEWTAACAGTAVPDGVVELRVTLRPRRLSIEPAAPSPSPFASCFARMADEAYRYNRPAARGSARIRVAITPTRSLLEDRVARVVSQRERKPWHGPTARGTEPPRAGVLSRVGVTVTTGPQGTSIEVTSWPKDPRAEREIEKQLRDALGPFVDATLPRWTVAKSFLFHEAGTGAVPGCEPILEGDAGVMLIAVRPLPDPPGWTLKNREPVIAAGTNGWCIGVRSRPKSERPTALWMVDLLVGSRHAHVSDLSAWARIDAARRWPRPGG